MNRKQWIALIMLLIAGAVFLRAMHTERQSFSLMQNSDLETECVVLTSHNKGPTVFIVAGVHGDEIAGVQATKQLSEELKLCCGRVYILPQANCWGCENNVRYLQSGEDLNRLFPGSSSGTDGEILAAQIFTAVTETHPALVISCHEAKRHISSGQGNGDSLIVSDIEGTADLLLPLLEETRSDTLCAVEYTLNGPGAKGGLNRELYDNAGIRAISIETLQDYPLEQRIADQKAIICRLLAMLEMI